jgi:hypothetical protein
VATRFEQLCHPLTLRAAFEQDARLGIVAEEGADSRSGRVDPVVDHDMTVAINDSNLAPPQMEIDGTIQHSWLLLCALSASQ